MSIYNILRYHLQVSKLILQSFLSNLWAFLSKLQVFWDLWSEKSRTKTRGRSKISARRHRRSTRKYYITHIVWGKEEPILNTTRPGFHFLSSHARFSAKPTLFGTSVGKSTQFCGRLTQDSIFVLLHKKDTIICLPSQYQHHTVESTCLFVHVKAGSFFIIEWYFLLCSGSVVFYSHHCISFACHKQPQNGTELREVVLLCTTTLFTLYFVWSTTYRPFPFSLIETYGLFSFRMKKVSFSLKFFLVGNSLQVSALIRTISGELSSYGGGDHQYCAAISLFEIGKMETGVGYWTDILQKSNNVCKNIKN